jgi:tripartite-type tricarboxylate transporter receptor subunit TctC
MAPFEMHGNWDSLGIAREHAMKLLRRQFLHLAAATAALPAVSRIARAQSYPSRPVRIIVGFPAGGPVDIIARLMAQWLSERLAQQFIIDNRPGAGSNIGTEAAVNAVPDGYSLVMVGAPNVIAASVYQKLSFNFIRDIAPVAGIMRIPNVMEVNPNFPARTVTEFIEYGKAHPGKINMASSGVGTSIHLSGELFMAMTGVRMTHVPYRGSAPALTDLIGGTVDVMFDNVPSSIEHIRTGKLRALAVTTSMRVPVLPNTPTVGDTVRGYEVSAWSGIGAPSRVSPEIVEKLNHEINSVLAEPNAKSRLADLGGTAMPGSPADFGNLIVDETEKWAKVVKFAGVEVD